MKRPKPELQNTRVIRLATRVVSFPFVCVAAVYRGGKGLLQSMKSDDRVRAEGQRRQSRVRRQLRGLAGDHVRGS